jgi:sigma-B regulation protein RsbU (phosphoserine phosphatase)
LFCEGEYSAARLRLEPGDSLVLYTDGLTEAVNPAGDEYGLDRLCSVLTRCGALAPGALIGAVLADLSAFQAGAPRSDDLTMLVLQRALTSIS